MKYFHTLRYLKPLQLFGRLWFYLYHPKPCCNPSPSLRNRSGNWVKPVKKQRSLLSEHQFHFLNRTHLITVPEDWNNPHIEKLWLYHLHYFDDLNAENASMRCDLHQRLIESWIVENPPAFGNGWEPYPISLRIVNWIKWILAGNEPTDHMLNSLAVQTRYLMKRLEYHLLGNHLFANAKALVFSGLFFNWLEASVWQNKGIQIIQQQIPEQILNDGGHFERSPMYHAIILEDMLDLINIGRAYKAKLIENPHWIEIIQKMRLWLKVMCHPDGKIVLFNDAAFGIAPTVSELELYADRLKLETLPELETGMVYLKDTGYIRLQNQSAVLFIDVAPIGPDYLPGHAHADTLTFELSLNKKRAIVDSGTSCYGTGSERQRQRSTKAHNTVTIHGENSSEVWGGFRTARRAKPFGLDIRHQHDTICVSCAHDGFCRIAGKPVHQRRWFFTNRSLQIKDTIIGSFKDAVSRFYFHPEISVQPISSDIEGILIYADGYQFKWRVVSGKPVISAATYHPYFGISLENKCLEIHFEQNEVIVEFIWEEE